jgi:hypothetical protein
MLVHIVVFLGPVVLHRERRDVVVTKSRGFRVRTVVVVRASSSGVPRASSRISTPLEDPAGLCSAGCRTDMRIAECQESSCALFRTLQPLLDS